MPIIFCSHQNEQNLDKSNPEVDDEMPIKPGIGIYKFVKLFLFTRAQLRSI